MESHGHNENNLFLRLSPEVMLCIFDYFADFRTLFNLLLTCKRFALIISDEHMQHYLHLMTKIFKEEHSKKVNFEGHVTELSTYNFSPHDLQVVFPQAKKHLQVIDMLTETVAFELAFPEKSKACFTEAQFSPNGEQVMALGGCTDEVYVWDVNSKNFLYALKHKNIVTSVLYSQDSKYIVSTDTTRVRSDDKVNLWNAATGELVYELHHPEAFYAVISPDNRYILSISQAYPSLRDENREILVKIWEIKTGKEIREAFRVPIRNSSRFICFSPDSRYIAMVRGDMLPATIEVCDVITGSVIRRLSGGCGRKYGVCFSPDGNFIACISNAYQTSNVYIFDLVSGKSHMFEATHIKDSIFSNIDFAPDSKHFLTCTFDGMVKVWDLYTLTQVFEFENAGQRCASANFSREGDIVYHDEKGRGESRVTLIKFRSRQFVIPNQLCLLSHDARVSSLIENYGVRSENNNKNKRVRMTRIDSEEEVAPGCNLGKTCVLS